MKKLLILIFLFILPINVNAKDEFIIDCNSYIYKEFDNFNCRSSVSSDFEFNKITFDLDLSKNISLDEIRSNFTSLWKLSINKNQIIAETNNNLLVSGLQEFGILMFSTGKYGKQNINIKNINLINSSLDKTLELKDVSQEIKILSSENKLKNIYIDGEKISGFHSETYNYNIKIDSSISKVNITTDLIDENAEIKGIGEIELTEKNNIIVAPIFVKSESGVTRIYRLNFIKEDIKSPNISSSNIELKDNKNNLIEFNFKSDVYEYNIEVGSSVTSINFKTQLEDSNLSLVKNFGNQTVDIVDGNNIVLIKIKNKDEDLKTYVFNITKLLSNKSANYYLKSLTIKNNDLKFNKRVKNYNLAIKKSVTKLNIKAIPEDDKSVINIIGNENLTAGSVIKIIVKAENESRFTYQINISYQKSNIFIYFLYIILLFGLFSIGRILFKKYQDKLKKVKKNPKSKNKSSKKPAEKPTIKKSSVKKSTEPQTKTKGKEIQKSKPKDIKKPVKKTQKKKTSKKKNIPRKKSKSRKKK